MPSKKNPEKKVREFRLNINIRTFFISFFILLFLYFSFQSLSGEINKALPEKSLTTVISEIKQKKVQKVEVIDNKVLIYYKNKNLAITYKETSDSFVSTLKDSGVNPNDLQIVVKDTQGSSSLMSFLSNFIPTILMVAFFIFLFRQAKGAQENVFSFGQSRAKKFNKDISKITFKDVAGVDEAKKELEEVVDFLRHPDKYKKVGARTPKGVILIGPPGCGKTLLALSLIHISEPTRPY